jgi:uncharacterized protein HemX
MTTKKNKSNNPEKARARKARARKSQSKKQPEQEDGKKSCEERRGAVLALVLLLVLALVLTLGVQALGGSGSMGD